MTRIIQTILMSIALIAAQLSTHPLCCCNTDHHGVEETTYHVHANGYGHWHRASVPVQSQSMPDEAPHDCHCEQDKPQFLTEGSKATSTQDFDSFCSIGKMEFVVLAANDRELERRDFEKPVFDRASARAAIGVYLL